MLAKQNLISELNADASPEYQSISGWAVASIIFSAVSVAGFISSPLGGFVLPSVVAGVCALVETQKFDKLGRWPAFLGIGFSLLMALAIPIWHQALYQSEATNGVLRLDFAKLSKANQFEDYAGQRVCLKGYPRPTTQQRASSFLMTWNGAEEADPVEVQLTPRQTLDYQWKPQAVSGVLSPHPMAGKENAPLWILLNSELRPVKSRHQLADYVGGRGC